MKRFVAALTILTLAGLTYVYTEIEAVEIGYAIQKQEEMKMLGLDRQRALKYNIARMKTPGVLEKRLEAGRIVLESPKAWQTLVLPTRGGSAFGGKNSARPPVNQPDLMRPFLSHPSLLTKFLIGTAQAEANES